VNAAAESEPVASREELIEAGARTLARERPVAPREYYAISEVCELVGLKPHVLRYWETQFAVLNPSKNRSGNRVYQRKEIRLILLVKTLLYEEKYTVDGARAKLDQMKKGGELAEATGRALDRHMLQVLRTDLQQLAGLLTPPRQ
jgi:DNA-binding transcriptional MerR regulator